MQQNILNSQPARFCYKCHHPAGDFDKKCVRCGGVVRTKAGIRMLGGVLVFLGGFISAMMAFVGMFIYGSMAQQQAKSSVGGAEAQQLMFAVGIIGLTFVVGVAFAFAGLWQIVFGRRNTIIVWVSIGLVIVLFVASRVFVGMAN